MTFRQGCKSLAKFSGRVGLISDFLRSGRSVLISDIISHGRPNFSFFLGRAELVDPRLSQAGPSDLSFFCPGRAALISDFLRLSRFGIEFLIILFTDYMWLSVNFNRLLNFRVSGRAIPISKSFTPGRAVSMLNFPWLGFITQLPDIHSEKVWRYDHDF